MSEVTVHLDGAAIARLLRSPQGPVVRHLIKRTVRVQERARELAPIKTGKLRASIVKRGPYDDALGVFMVVVSNLNYALFVHEGTKPHPIYARSSPFLVFDWPGGPNGPGIYYFRMVNHPGTKANPFLRRALAEAVA